MRRIGASLCALALLGCSPKGISANDQGSDSGSESSSTSSSGSSESGEPGETETGEDSPPDACPASPVLAQLWTKFDDYEVGYEYPDAVWDEPCTVVADQGALVGGQTITLACTDSEGTEVEHVLQVQAELVDAEQPSKIPVSVGEPLRLTLWSRVWFAGGAAWALRNPDQPDDVRLIFYSTIEPPTVDSNFSPPPEFIAPLVLVVDDDVCESDCPEPGEPPEPGGFVPSEDCGCFREQALQLDIGGASALIQHDSAGAIGESWFAFVDNAFRLTDVGSCADVSESWYGFLLVPR